MVYTSGELEPSPGTLRVVEPASDALQQLERARAALQAGAGVTALRALIDAWRSHRTPEVAELVERLSPRVAQGRELPAAKTQIKSLANWLVRSRERNPADLHVLLDAFEQIVARGHVRPITTALDELAEWPDDPRVGVRIIRCVEVRAVDYWMFRRYFAALIASGDPRTLPALASLDHAWAVEEFEGRLAALGAAAKPNAHAAIDAACEALRRLIDTATLDPAAEDHTRADAPKTREQLLDAIYAEPNNDAARLVLGDWLQSRGDPLGELISLQFRRREHPPTAEAQARERELLDAHAKIWLGPLARLVRVHKAKFERGFPIEVEIKPIKAGLVDIERGHREWATLERVTFDDSLRGRGSIISPNMRAIRELEHVCDKGLLALATECDSLPVEYVSYVPNPSKGAAALRECSGLARLRSFCIDSVYANPGHVEWLWDTKVGRQLDTFTSTRGWERLADWTHVPANVQRVAIRSRASWCMIERDRAGRWTRVHMHLAAPLEGHQLPRTLAGLAADQLAEIRVEITATQEQRAELIGQIESAVARFEGARLEISEATNERPPWLPKLTESSRPEAGVTGEPS